MTEELKHISAFCINICILYLHLHPCNNMLDTAGMQHSSTAMSRLKAAFRCFPSIDSGWPKMTLRLGAYNKWISVRSKHSSVSAANDIHFYLHEFRHKPWQHDDNMMTTWWQRDESMTRYVHICSRFVVAWHERRPNGSTARGAWGTFGFEDFGGVSDRLSDRLSDRVSDRVSDMPGGVVTSLILFLSIVPIRDFSVYSWLSWLCRMYLIVWLLATRHFLRAQWIGRPNRTGVRRCQDLQTSLTATEDSCTSSRPPAVLSWARWQNPVWTVIFLTLSMAMKTSHQSALRLHSFEKKSTLPCLLCRFFASI